MVFLATGGESLRTWNIRGNSVKADKSINQHTEGITAVKWSHNNKIIATSSLDGTIVLTFNKNGEEFMKFRHVEENNSTKKYSVNCVSFSSGSRYVISGGENGIVKIWDIKKNATRTVITDHCAPVNCTTFNKGKDDMIASGGDSGTIYIHASSDGKKLAALSPAEASQKVPVKAIDYSTLRKHTLCAAYEDGSIRVWDTLSGKITTEFRRKHRLSATSTLFSPINRLLMVSAGLDKRVLFYDIDRNIEVNRIDVPTPITTMSVYSDGVTMAVGTESGEVMIYDIRGGCTPSTTFSAFSSSVKSIQFSHDVQSTEKARTTLRSTASTALISTRSTYQLGSDKTASVARRAKSAASFSRSGDVLIKNEGDVETSKLTRFSSINYKGHVKTLNLGIERKSPLEVPHTSIEIPQRSPESGTPAPASILPIRDVKSSTSTHVSEATDPLMEDEISISPEVFSSVESPILPIENSFQSPMIKGNSSSPKADLEFLFNPETNNSQGHSNAVSTPLYNNSPNSTSGIQKKLLNHMLDEKIDAVKQDILKSIQNLHLDMICQFQQQQNEFIDQISRLDTKLESLVEENQRLHDENESLRSIY